MTTYRVKTTGETRFNGEPWWGIYKSGKLTTELNIKSRAVDKAAQRARQDAPSKLVIEREDGTVQDTREYDKNSGGSFGLGEPFL